MPSLRMYEDQCKADREGADSDASSSETPAGRDQVHSPLGGASSPLRFSRPSRGECSSLGFLKVRLMLQKHPDAGSQNFFVN